MKSQYSTLLLLLLGLLVSAEAFRGRAGERKKKFCEKAVKACEEETDVTKAIIKTCVFDPNAAEGEVPFKTITESKKCTKARVCSSEERFVHKGECGKDCDSLSALCDSMGNKRKEAKKAGKRAAKKGGKRGGKRGGIRKMISFCDQNGKPLSKKCDIFSMRCQAIADDTDGEIVKKFTDLPQLKRCPRVKTE